MDLLKRLIEKFGSLESSLSIVTDSRGLGFSFSDDDYSEIQVGGGSRLSQHQYLTMQLLLEQGLGEPIRSGFYLEAEDAVRLDFDTRETLMLPEPWPGRFLTETNGVTHQPGFSISLVLEDLAGKQIRAYRLEGPLLVLSEHEKYLPDGAQWQLLHSVQEHSNLDADDQDELANLRTVYNILDAKSQGVEVSVVGFDRHKLIQPDYVSVTVQELPDGGLALTPSFGEPIDPENIEKRLGQIATGKLQGSLRVEKKILLLDEKRMAAAREILANAKISAKDRSTFLKNPTAWLDASLVDLDLGFSFRVKGAGPLKHAYFGDTDETGIGWFELSAAERKARPDPVPVGPGAIVDLVKDRDELAALEKRIDDAVAAGADSVTFKNSLVDISDVAQVRKSIQATEEMIDANPQLGDTELELEPDVGEPAVLDIDSHDESIGGDSVVIEAPPIDFRSSDSLDYSSYKRKPFPHQDEGVRWLLGMARENWCKGIEAANERGALLADDMGLGKTYMSLVFLREYLDRIVCEGQTVGPVLVVAPLVLMENWRRELEETYATSFFDRVVVLQADADLKQFRIEGARNELSMNRGLGAENEPELNRGIEAQREDMISSIRYALKVGKEFGAQRLDLPRTIVLTTYQTLRDYQFSLARVDWSVVVFDEAQNIKNPNAIQTRAAKALKAQFKLLITGTPVENNLGEYWCLFDTLQPTFLGSYQDFRRNYIQPIVSASVEDISSVRATVGKQLRDYVGGFMLRRIKEDHLDGLPQKKLILGGVDDDGSWLFDQRISRVMSGVQLDRYESVINSTIELIESEDGHGQALAGLARLRQVSLHPDLLEGGHPGIPTSKEEAREIFGKSGKLLTVLDLLDEIRGRGEKTIIFLVAKKMQEVLSLGLKRIYNCEARIINGDTKTFAKRKTNDTRQGIIDRFEAAEGFEVLIMSPVAAGVGLTITAANNVIHLDRHWNPAKEAQATDRVYRIGQTKDVNVYFPTLLHPEMDSFDVNLNKLLSSKIGLTDAVMVPDEVRPEEFITSGMFGSKVDVMEEPLTIEDVDRLSWDMFEAFVAEWYAAQGKDVLLTLKGKDKGCDVVILESDGTAALVEAKHTENTNQFDGYAAISQIYGAGPHYEKALRRAAPRRIVVTNAKRYSNDAVRHARNYNVELVSRKKLAAPLSKAKITYGSVVIRNQKRRKV